MTTTTETVPDERHWLTKYDALGDPYGVLCHCAIGVDHEPTDRPNGDEANEMPPATAEPQPLTLTEFIAAQLRSKHILDGRFVQMSATADGTRIDIDIEHPFPPERRIRVVAQLEVLVPDGLDDDEQDAESRVEIGASALVEDLRNTLDVEAGLSAIVPADEPAAELDGVEIGASA